MRNAVIAVAALAQLGAGPVLAQERADGATWKATLKPTVESGTWTLVAYDRNDDAATYYLAASIKADKDDNRRVEIRNEYNGPSKFGEFTVRSNVQTWTVECKTLWVQIHRMQIFELNNLRNPQGERVANPPQRRSPNEQAVASRELVAKVCAEPLAG